MRCGRKLLALLPLLAGLASCPFWAQGSGNAMPAISRLRAAVEKDTVALTWQDATSGAPSYLVFRGREPFSGSSLPRAERIGTVGPGIGHFEDQAPPSAGWYYLVLAVDENGKPFEVFTRMGTMTAIALSIEAPPAAVPEPVPTPAKASSLEPAPASLGMVEAATPPTPELASIHATISASKSAETQDPAPQAPAMESSIEAPSDAPPEVASAGSEIAVMYAASPGPAAHLQAEAQASPEIHEGRISEAPLSPAFAEIQGANPLFDLHTALEPDPLPLSVAIPNFEVERPSPLPTFLYGPVGGDGPSPASRRIPQLKSSGELTKAMAALDIGDEGIALPAMPDLGHLTFENPDGDVLESISLTMIETKDFESARKALDSYLTRKISREDAMRARYYLGICLAKLGLLQEGLFELLQAQPNHPAETKPWINYIIDTLAHFRTQGR